MDAPATPRPRPWAPLVVGSLTLLFTLVLCFQSSELHTVERALREHEALVGEQPEFKLYQAWKKVRFERALGTGSAQMDDVQKLIIAGRELMEKHSAIQDDLLQASQLHALPAWMQPAAEPAPPATPQELAEEAVEDARCAAIAMQAPAAPVGSKPLPARSGQQDLIDQRQEFMCFLRQLKVTADALDYPTWGALFAARDKVSLLVSWLLPGLYGLLGACFFLMRTMLQTGQERLPGSDRALAAVDILLRMAAGGLAGIIVGWFSVPATGAAVGAGSPSISFGLAFLAGFSTDALFSMLDRLLRGLTPAEPPRPGPA